MWSFHRMWPISCVLLQTPIHVITFGPATAIPRDAAKALQRSNQKLFKLSDIRLRDKRLSSVILTCLAILLRITSGDGDRAMNMSAKQIAKNVKCLFAFRQESMASSIGFDGSENTGGSWPAARIWNCTANRADQRGFAFGKPGHAVPPLLSLGAGRCDRIGLGYVGEQPPSTLLSSDARWQTAVAG